MKLIVAMRGRNPDNPNSRKRGIPTEQRLEPNPWGVCNTLTTIQKDNLVMEIDYCDTDSDSGDQHRGGGLGRFADTATTLMARDYKGFGHQQSNVVMEIEQVDDYIYVRQATKSGYVKCKVGGVADMNYENSDTRRGRVIDEGDTSMTITANGQPNVLEPWTWEIDGKRYRIRIRKLTPRECWRLMGFGDDDFDKAQKVNSNTQLYKQAGNSIVVPVLEGIFRNILSCLNGETTIKAKAVEGQLTFSEVFNWQGGK